MTDSDYVYSASDGPAQLGLSRGAMPWGVTLAALAGMAAIPFFGALSDASAAGRRISSARRSRSPARVLQESESPGLLTSCSNRAASAPRFAGAQGIRGFVRSSGCWARVAREREALSQAERDPATLRQTSDFRLQTSDFRLPTLKEGHHVEPTFCPAAGRERCGGGVRRSQLRDRRGRGRHCGGR